jgi:hypothetical protein
MTPSKGTERIGRESGLWWKFPLHQVVSTIGVLVAAGFLAFATSTSSQARSILTDHPYFPVQVSLAFAAGFLLRRYLRHEVMRWVWVLPSLIVLVVLALTPLPVGERIGRLFGTSCKPELGCFDQLAVTLPFYTAISYSLAAFLSGLLQKRVRRIQGAAQTEAASR